MTLINGILQMQDIFSSSCKINFKVRTFEKYSINIRKCYRHKRTHRWYGVFNTLKTIECYVLQSY